MWPYSTFLNFFFLELSGFGATRFRICKLFIEQKVFLMSQFRVKKLKEPLNNYRILGSPNQMGCMGFPLNRHGMILKRMLSPLSWGFFCYIIVNDINYTYIVLISKVKNLKKIIVFCPINLCNTFYETHFKGDL